MEVLSKGLNFNVTYNKLPKEDIAVKIQSATHHLTEENKRIANAEVAAILKRAKPVPTNLTQPQK